MISMEIAMNLTDYLLTGGAILTWWVVPIMLAVDFYLLGRTITGDLNTIKPATKNIMNEQMIIYLISMILGIMLFFSFVIAPVVFKTLNEENARKFIRRIFLSITM